MMQSPIFLGRLRKKVSENSSQLEAVLLRRFKVLRKQFRLVGLTRLVVHAASCTVFLLFYWLFYVYSNWFIWIWRILQVSLAWFMFSFQSVLFSDSVICCGRICLVFLSFGLVMLCRVVIFDWCRSWLESGTTVMSVSDMSSMKLF